MLGLVFSFVVWMLNPSGEENFTGLKLISNLSNLLISIILLLMVKFVKTNKKDIIIFFMSLFSVVGYLETAFKNRKTPNELLDFITGSIVQEIMFVLLIGKVNWRLITLFAITNMSYCFWRGAVLRKTLKCVFFLFLSACSTP